MTQTILITGSTDGIGLETAKRLASEGHDLLLHGRNPAKLDDAEGAVREQGGKGRIALLVGDLSRPVDVIELADAVIADCDGLDVVINNAGVFKVAEPLTSDGLDVRFAVNTIAPYLLTRRLLPLVRTRGTVINVSSAAQAPVDLRALRGEVQLSDGDAYAQSKLALTMWSRHLALELGADGPSVVAVNPGSLLATKMVKEGYGIAGNDIGIGADILIRAALSDEFAEASGQYFDNDSGRFAPPHPDALDPEKTDALVNAVDSILGGLV